MSPRSRWPQQPIEELLVEQDDGRKLHQGWSPQCEGEASSSETQWGVLKTTSIQPLEFLPEHNKALPPALEPRPNLEVREGDLLITCAGPRGRCGVSCLVEHTRRRLMISGKMYRFRANESLVSSRYLAMYLQSAPAQDDIDLMKSGGSESGLNLTHERFSKLQVPVAPRPEQERVVQVLDLAFEAMATAQANTEKSLGSARRLFEGILKSVFIKRGQAWSERTLDACLDKVESTAKIQRKAFLSSGALPVISQESEFINGYWNNRADALRVERPLVVFGDHTRVLKYIDFDFVLGADGVKVLLPKKDIHPKFFYHQLRSVRLESLGYARHFRLLKNARLTFPRHEEQTKLAEYLDHVEAAVQDVESIYERKLAALSALKQSLLHQAFTGQL